MAVATRALPIRQIETSGASVARAPNHIRHARALTRHRIARRPRHRSARRTRARTTPVRIRRRQIIIIGDASVALRSGHVFLARAFTVDGRAG